MIVTIEPDAEPLAVQREPAGAQALMLEEFAGLAAAVRGARS